MESTESTSEVVDYQATAPDNFQSIFRPTIVYIFQWLNERFPVINLVSSFVMFAMLASVSRRIQILPWKDSPVRDVFVALALAAFFLLMRVSDEFKDYELDLINYPNRVLQSGKIRLKHVALVGVLCLAFIVAVTWQIQRDGVAIFACGLNLIMAVLINREFFCGPWLRRHIIIYALSHMVVAITASFWVVSLASSPTQFSWALVALMGYPYFNGMTFEFARKTFGLEENKPRLESYSRILGSTRAALLTLASLFFSWIYFLALAWNIFPGKFGWALGISAAPVAFAVMGLFRYIDKPNRRGRKWNEAATGLAILVNYLTMAGLVVWS